MFNSFHNKTQLFQELAYWKEWFNGHFDENVSVNYHPSVREQAYQAILKKDCWRRAEASALNLSPQYFTNLIHNDPFHLLIGIL